MVIDQHILSVDQHCGGRVRWNADGIARGGVGQKFYRCLFREISRMTSRIRIAYHPPPRPRNFVDPNQKR